MARRVVITGISSHWGAELARRLERDPEISYIAGIDTRPPPAELESRLGTEARPDVETDPAATPQSQSKAEG